MLIGTSIAILTRFSIYKRYYKITDYITSAFYGLIIGAAYSPYFLANKVNDYRLKILMETDVAE